jgi:cell wall-associated NlpC family hydrolase
MRPIRLLLPLLALSLVLLGALLRPLPGRAERNERAPGGKSLGSGAPPTPRPRSGRAPRRSKRRLAAHALSFGTRVARFAEHLVGIPYRYGGTSPRSGFDCSGLVRYVYGHFGISLAHSSFADFVSGRRIGLRQLRPGDLVFFDGAGHVGIYVGHSRFIDAPHSGTVVRISTMDWYGSRFSGARRIR